MIANHLTAIAGLIASYLLTFGLGLLWGYVWTANRHDSKMRKREWDAFVNRRSGK